MCPPFGEPRMCTYALICPILAKMWRVSTVLKLMGKTLAIPSYALYWYALNIKDRP